MLKWIVALALVGVLASVLILPGGWQELGLIEGLCQDIYSYYPSFRCCDEIQEWEGSKTLTYSLLFYDNAQTYRCPDTASHCEVLLSSPDFAMGTQVFKGLTNCKQGGLLGQAWVCDDDEVVPIGSWFDVSPGAWVHLIGPSSVNINYKHFGFKLCECSLSPCGVPCPGVLFSDGCGFNTNDAVYDADGRIKIGVDAESYYAYTVPFGSCYAYYPDINKHPIGNTCEECSSNADCKSKYPLSYSYFGTEYGAICGSGAVQLYSCQDTGANVCIAFREDAAGTTQDCMEYGKAAKCDLYLSIPVQCCPGTSDCGPQSFCNPDTYTCSATAECYADTDCGHAVMCDYTSKQLKTPICSGGICTFRTENVGCCYDGNCPSGWYCAADYTCKESTDVMDECPYECCVDMEGFFDRPCEPGYECCPDHTCQVSCDDVPPLPEESLIWLIIPILAVILGVIGYLMSGTLGAVILGFIGGIAGYLIYWVSQLPLFLQILIGLGLGSLGILGVYLLGGTIAAVIVAIAVGAVKK